MSGKRANSHVEKTKVWKEGKNDYTNFECASLLRKGGN